MRATAYRTLWALAIFLGLSTPSQAAFHLWEIKEVYSNASGTLQFIEFFTPFDSQQFVVGQQLNSINFGGSPTNTFTFPVNLPGSSTNRHFLMGTSGVQAAGGPAPDFIMPNGFLFTPAGTINFFGTNSGSYSALPIDGTMSLNWATMTNNSINSPTNFAGASGVVVVPEPTSMALASIGAGLFAWSRRRRKQLASE